MFAHVLAVLLGLGSLLFYLAAFFYPEVHRRSDFLWGGLGLLYSAVLWFGAGQMTSLVLLGQMVAVALLLGLGWQTLTVRRQKTPVYQQTPIVLTPEVVGGWAKSKLNELRIVPDENVRPVRLERRAIEGAAVLNARLDPRRRPAYDYEFVEDGAGLAEVQQGELFSTAFAKETTDSSDGLGEAVADFAYLAPPSAEAEVVAVEPAVEKAVSEENVAEEGLSEALTSEAPTSEALTSEEAAFEKGLSEVLISEEAVLEETAPEEAVFEEAASEETVFEEAASEEFIAEDGDLKLADFEPESEVELELSDPGLDEIPQTMDDLAIAHKTSQTQWIDEAPIAASQSKSPAVTTVKKPSLLAMPLILVGWVKDVVVSLTKPKPSKPIIEIPRRDAGDGDPGVRDAGLRPPAESNRRYNDESEDDDWEDSNWAD